MFLVYIHAFEGTIAYRVNLAGSINCTRAGVMGRRAKSEKHGLLCVGLVGLENPEKEAALYSSFLSRVIGVS